MQELATLVPSHVLTRPKDDDGIATIDPNFLRYDMDFRQALRCWREDLEDGHLDPAWLRQAHQAMEERAQGNFDGFEARLFVRNWGQNPRGPYMEDVISAELEGARSKFVEAKANESSETESKEKKSKGVRSASKGIELKETRSKGIESNESESNESKSKKSKFNETESKGTISSGISRKTK